MSITAIKETYKLNNIKIPMIKRLLNLTINKVIKEYFHTLIKLILSNHLNLCNNNLKYINLDKPNKIFQFLIPLKLHQ